MANTVFHRRRGRARSRAVGLLSALAAHVVVLAVLAWGLQPQTAYSPAPAIDVRLIQAWPISRAASPKPAAPTKTRRPAAPAPAALATGAAPIAPPAPTPTAAAPPKVTAGAEGLAAALRGSAGCDHGDLLGMSPEEQRHCRESFAGHRGGGPDLAGLGADPEKQAAFDAGIRRETFLQRPFLAQRPSKGCKPRVVEHSADIPAKAPNDWTVSAACAIPF